MRSKALKDQKIEILEQRKEMKKQAMLQKTKINEAFEKMKNKGKLDPNETIEACALREVMEETGVSNLVLGDLIMTTTHLYHDKYVNTEVEKITYWYKMTTDQLQDGIPQTEEEIEAIAWVKKEDIAPYLAKTYDTIKQVMEAFLTSMNE